MLLYALLHLSGFEDVSMEEVKNFRHGVQKHQVTQNLVIQQGLTLQLVL